MITSAVGVAQVNPTTFTIGNINWVQGYAGTYTLTVNAASVSDLAGNAGSNSTNESWTLILETPAAPANLMITPDLGISSTDGLTSTNNIIFSGTVGASNLNVQVFDQTLGLSLGAATMTGTNFSIPLEFTTEGSHNLQANAVDAAGNVSLASFFGLFLDIIPPTAIIQQVTSPSYSAVSSIPVVFSKPINTNTISATNFVVTLSGTTLTPTLTYVSGNTFLLGNLNSFTTPLGTYQVSLYLDGIQDDAGNQSTNVVTMSWTHGTLPPPVITQVASHSIADGQSMTITNQAQAATPPVRFSLGSSAPAGASITTNGIFNWTPTCVQGSSTNLITIWATDSGSPPLSNSMTFTVLVGECVQVGIGSTAIQVGQTGGVPITLLSSVGLTNLNFTLLNPSQRFTSWAFASSNSSIATAAVQVLASSNAFLNIDTLTGQSLQSNTLLGTMFISPLPGDSAFLPLVASNILGMELDGNVVGNVLSQAGRVVVIGPQPLLQPQVGPNSTRLLTLYGNPGTNYQFWVSTNLASPNWQSGWSGTITNLFEFIPVDQTVPQIFIRVQC